jgi:hypothetical protein
VSGTVGRGETNGGNDGNDTNDSQYSNDENDVATGSTTPWLKRGTSTFPGRQLVTPDDSADDQVT